jgi:hypothetical protein
MADMMGPQMPPGGMPMRPTMPAGTAPGAAPGGAAETVQKMQSIFNPVDIAGMLQRGEITPQTRFIDLLAKMGIGPDDTLADVVQKTVAERRKALPVQKMKAIAQAGPGGPMPQPAQPGMPNSQAGRRPAGNFEQIFGM